MAKVIQLQNQPTETINEADIASRFKSILKQRQKGQMEPLTVEKLKRRPGLESLTDAEALQAIDTIKKLAAILFATACRKEASCIDNQHVVHLNQENKAA
jgi:hypothetical protein